MKSQRDQAKAIVEFRIHLFTFIAVMSLLAVINLLASPGYLWFVWPLLGWGIGLIAHYLNVYFSNGHSSLKDRMIEKEMNKGS